MPIPEQSPDARYGRADHRAAFVAFLEFIRMNLAGQTPIRIDASWCTQGQTISSFSDFASPDHIFREEELQAQLAALAQKYGHTEPPAIPQAPSDLPFALDDIYDAELETLAADVYQRDYISFGFGPWRKEPAD